MPMVVKAIKATAPMQYPYFFLLDVVGLCPNNGADSISILNQKIEKENNEEMIPQNKSYLLNY